jgi:hypothetical protein
LIEGKLIFPPSAPWDDSTNTGWRQKVEEVEPKMVLGVIVTAVVDRHEDSLLVKCEDMQIDMKGDPMIDSWLPRDDVLNDIQKMLYEVVNEATPGGGEAVAPRIVFRA